MQPGLADRGGEGLVFFCFFCNIDELSAGRNDSSRAGEEEEQKTWSASHGSPHLSWFDENFSQIMFSNPFSFASLKIKENPTEINSTTPVCLCCCFL